MLSVQIFDIVVPDQYKIDGKVYLDVGDASLTSKRNRPGLNDKNKNLTNAAQKLDIEFTPLNRMICEPFINAHIKGQRFAYVDAYVADGGHVLEYDSVRVLSRNDKQKTYSVQLSNKNNNPLTKIKQRKLNTLGLGFIFYNRPTLEAQFPNYRYNDGDPGHRYGFINFGGTYEKNRFVVEDMRPTYSPLYLFKKMFEAEGWIFESPILETDFWREVWCYLGDETYGGTSADNLSAHKFIYQKEADERLGDMNVQVQGFDGSTVNVLLDQWDIILDPRNGYHEPYHATNRGVLQDFTLEYRIDATNVPRDEEIQILISVADIIVATETIVLVDEENFFENEIFGSFNQYIPPTKFAAVTARIIGHKDLIVKRRKFYNNPTGLRYIEGQYINMSEPISPKLSGYDFFVGIQHMIGGIPNINIGTQTITLEVPYDVDVWTQNVIGYLKNNPKASLQDVIVSQTQRLSAPLTKQKRYTVYGYKRSSDAYIKTLGLESGENLFDKKVDLGIDYEEGTKFIRNPLFEPTSIRDMPKVTDGLPPFLATCTDNDDNEVSIDVGYRIFLATPNVGQNYLDEDGGAIGAVSLKWHDSVLFNIPTYYMSIEGKTVEIAGLDTTKNLMYGDDEDGNDLWGKYLKVKALSKLLSQDISFDTSMSLGKFSLMDLSSMYTIQYGYEFIQGFLTSITFDHTKETGVLKIEAEIDSLSEVEGATDSSFDDRKCYLNQPGIRYQSSGVNDRFYPVSKTAPGNIVDTMTWDYRTKTASGTWTAWQSFPVVQPLYVEITKFFAQYEVRLTIRYTEIDGLRCPDKEAIYPGDPCGHLINFDLDVGYDIIQKKNKIRLNLNNSSYNGTITGIVSTYIVDGGTETAYNIDINTLLGDYIEATTTFTIQTLEITFANECMYELQDPLVRDVIEHRDKATPGILEGELKFKKVGLTRRSTGGRYEPSLDEMLVNGTPDVLIWYRNTETTDYGESWNRGVGAVPDPEFKVVFDYGPTKVSTDWVVRTPANTV